MKQKQFTTDQVARWMVTFYKYDTEETYISKLQALECLFGANSDNAEDREFWNEVCHKAEDREFWNEA